MKILKGIGIIIFGIPICVAVSHYLEIEWIVYLMTTGIYLIIFATIFNWNDEK